MVNKLPPEQEDGEISGVKLQDACCIMQQD